MRRKIFVEEQALFQHDDVDTLDAIAHSIIAVEADAPSLEVFGVVRIYEAEPRLWYGGRLGTHPDRRKGWQIGKGLIHKAVTTANAWGCDRFLATDPWFAGWSAVMVNVSDIYAMGGRPIAIVDTLWTQDATISQPLLAGMSAAARAYQVPIVGGHTNARSGYNALSVSIIRRAETLISGFKAQPGDRSAGTNAPQISILERCHHNESESTSWRPRAITQTSRKWSVYCRKRYQHGRNHRHDFDAVRNL